jgi:hypothetical protein
MPRADEYASAAEVCDVQAHRWRLMEHDELSQRQALAARCVRAMAALASGEVRLFDTREIVYGENGAVSWRVVQFVAVRGDDRFPRFPAADPLDAITAALGGDDA